MKNRKQLYRMTACALLTALVFVLGMTPMGLIPLGFINVTILCVPVIAGALLLGIRSGLLLGFSFGFASMLSMMGVSMTPPSLLASDLFSRAPVLAILMCFIPRILVPATAYGMYRLLLRMNCRERVAIPVAAAIGSLTNTVLYLGLMLLFYAVSALDYGKIMSLIAGTGLIGGGCEAVAAALIVTPVVMALKKTRIGTVL